MSRFANVSSAELEFVTITRCPTRRAAGIPRHMSVQTRYRSLARRTVSEARKLAPAPVQPKPIVRPCALRKTARHIVFDLPSCFSQDGASFYRDGYGLVASYPHLVNSDYDMVGAMIARQAFVATLNAGL